MRVLHVQKAKGIGGAERHLLDLLPALRDRGIQVRMCVLAAPGAEAYETELRRVGIDTVMLKAGSDFNVRLVWSIAQAARGFRADLIHTHLIHADLWGTPAARLARCRVVSSVHDTGDFYRKVHVRVAARLVARLMHRRIAISQHVADYLVELGLAREARLDVVHYGIDASRWQVSRAIRDTFRSDLGLEESDVVFGLASRLVPGKGHDTVLGALALIDDPKVKVVIAGDGPLRDDLGAASRDLIAGGRLVFMGFVSDMPRFMAGCDVLVFPTTAELSEGFGLAALEAMAAGRPVIASDVGALPEVVDSTSGILVPPSSPAELARAMQHVASDPQLLTELGRGARRRAEDSFAFDRMVDGTLETYRRALG